MYRWLITLAALVCNSLFAIPAESADAPKAAALPTPTHVGWGPHGKKLYYFLIMGNSTPGNEEEMNRWYDRIHAPVMIESGDFVWSQRFAASPVQFGRGAGSADRQFMVIFAIETNDIEKVLADTNRRLQLPRNISSKTLDYSSLLSFTFEAQGPPITQKEAQRLLAEETAAGRVPPADAPGTPQIPPPATPR